MNSRRPHLRSCSPRRSHLLPTAGALLAIALFACGAPQTAQPDDAPESAQEVLAAIEARAAPIETLRILAIAEYYGRDGRVRVRQAIVASRPDRLRVDTLSPMDNVLSVLAADGSMLRLYDTGDERFLEGEASARNVARLIPLWLSPADLVSALIGTPPLSEVDMSDPDAWPAPTWDHERGAWQVDLPRRTGGLLQLFVSDETWTVVAARALLPDGDVEYELRTGRPQLVEAGDAEIQVPRILRFLMPSRDLDLSLEVERYELNPELPANLFELEPPRGVRVESF